MKEQLLDDMALERERGITIKAHPGLDEVHVQGAGVRAESDRYAGPRRFSLRSFAVARCAAKGPCCLVDAFQGVEAQTVANAYAAMHHDLTIVPVINKIDLTHARVDEVQRGNGAHAGDRRRTKCSAAAARSGIGCEEVLAAVIERVPPPTGDPKAVLQAMVFDSVYDEYRGAVTYVRVMNGTVRKGQRIKFLQADTTHEVIELGQFTPRRVGREELTAGQVGYIICNIKSLGNIHIGDTVTVADGEPAAGAARLPGAEADGLLRPVSVRRPGLRAAPRRARQALDQRPQLRVRARIERRAGLRLPLRLPGPVAHGDRAAAAGAGFRHRPRADGAERDVRNHDQHAARSSRFTRRKECPTRARSRSFASRSCA